MSDAVQLVLAVGMGAVLGPILAVPQWRVLRRYVARAGWWVPANSAAWAVGMALVFQAAGSTPWPLSVATLAGPLVLLTLAGAAVGAIHGAVLAWLLEVARPPTLPGSARGPRFRVHRPCESPSPSTAFHPLSTMPVDWPPARCWSGAPATGAMRC